MAHIGFWVKVKVVAFRIWCAVFSAMLWKENPTIVMWFGISNQSPLLFYNEIKSRFKLKRHITNGNIAHTMLNMSSTNVSWSVIVVQMTTFVMRGPRFESNYGIFTITIDQLLFANWIEIMKKTKSARRLKIILKPNYLM